MIKEYFKSVTVNQNPSLCELSKCADLLEACGQGIHLLHYCHQHKNIFCYSFKKGRNKQNKKTFSYVSGKCPQSQIYTTMKTKQKVL